MTHDELVEKARGWLRGRCKYICVNAKPFSCDEHADAIGWAVNGESTVVECKVSFQDYQADWRKRWRRTSNGMGFFKYYLFPPELIEEAMNPFRVADQCGVLVAKGNGCHVVREAQPRQQRCWSEEVCLLLSQITNRMVRTGEGGGGDDSV